MTPVCKSEELMDWLLQGRVTTGHYCHENNGLLIDVGSKAFMVRPTDALEIKELLTPLARTNLAGCPTTIAAIAFCNTVLTEYGQHDAQRLNAARRRHGISCSR